MAQPYEYNLGRAFSRTASTHADRVALRIPGETDVRFGALDRLANRFAWILIGRGVKRGSTIAIVHSKTANCYALMLASLKIGAAYLNVDERNPEARLRHVFSRAEPSLIVVDALAPDVRTGFSAFGVPIIDLRSSEVQFELALASDAEPATTEHVTGADPAYLMFTSGSTGAPKGVVISHAAVLAFRMWIAHAFDVSTDDVFTNLNPMYFDNSVFDFYGSLFNGASLVAIGRTLAANPAAMLDELERAGATVWFSVPSMLIYLTKLDFLESTRLPSIRAIVFGGEGYPKPELAKLYGIFGSSKSFYNVYGPTECTCMCSAYCISASDLVEPTGLVTLGPIAPNFDVLVLDESGVAVEFGDVGELYLGGPQVGLGYVNDPELTAASFVQNPRHRSWRDIVYRTGDLVRLSADGRSLDFVGRRDHQIKHMGYRIELEEIELALNSISEIFEAAVVLVETEHGAGMLAAFTGSVSDVSVREIRDALARCLPDYMLPERIVQLRVLPKNANGKIDRQALHSLLCAQKTPISR